MAEKQLKPDFAPVKHAEDFGAEKGSPSQVFSRVPDISEIGAFPSLTLSAVPAAAGGQPGSGQTRLYTRINGKRYFVALTLG